MRPILTLLRWGACVLFAHSMLWPGTSAQASITDAVAWLEASQDPSGLWGTTGRTPFRDATVVIDLLARQAADSTVIANGVHAVLATETRPADHLARAIICIAAQNPDRVPGGYVTELVGRQNTDGGWGYDRGYGSNQLDTALALRALWSVSYAGSTVLGNGVGHLTSLQNGDGGWSFLAGGPSSVFFTSHAVISLALLANDYSVTTELQAAVAWLQSQVNGDDGFGDGGTSNPYETGLALSAIGKVDPLATEVTNAGDVPRNHAAPRRQLGHRRLLDGDRRLRSGADCTGSRGEPLGCRPCRIRPRPMATWSRYR